MLRSMNTQKSRKNKLLFALAFLTAFWAISTPAKAEDFEFGFLFGKEAVSFQNKKITLFYGDKQQAINLGDFLIQESVLISLPGHYSEIENFHKCAEEINGLEICDLTTPLATKNHNKKGSAFFLQTQKLKQQLEKYTEEIRQEPREGKMEMTAEGGLRIIEQSNPGIELDVESTLNKIKETAVDTPEKIEFSVKKTAPKISTENISSLGIKELIGHGESNFRGSPKNRIHNIKVATEKFHGILIEPGQEFSFTTILGPVDETTGYKEELVIKQNKTIPEFGGGVCQVSTTMFRVALNTGLPITERHNHAYPVQYYAPQGTDATIYVPKPDFKFLNDTPGYILVQAKIEGTILSFDMFGTSDGRKVELEGPKVTERTADGKLKTVLYQIVNNSEGTLVRKDTFKSFYDNPAKYHEPQFTSKPSDWSGKQWDEYKAVHGL